jgi:hypothetical protein
MKRVLDYHALIPRIQIDKTTLSQIQQASRSRPPNDESVGLIIGKPDFSEAFPVITFFKFSLIAGQDQPTALQLNDSEVPAYVLFQMEPIGDLTEFLKDYIESNRILNRYSSNFYYHPFCTASYSDTLHLQMHLVTPNLFLTMVEVNDRFESNAPKKRSSYASYSQPVKGDSCVRTTYFGITGPEDPRILALSYSIALTYRGIPIHALIQKSVYQIEVSVANNMYLYEGNAKFKSGMAAFKYKYQGSYEFHLEQPEQPKKSIQRSPALSEAESAWLLPQIEEMNRQITQLTAQLTEQEVAFQSALQAKSDETRDLLSLIQDKMQRMQDTEPRKIPRFGLARPVPAMDSPDKPARIPFDISPRPVPVAESTTEPPVSREIPEVIVQASKHSRLLLLRWKAGRIGRES